MNTPQHLSDAIERLALNPELTKHEVSRLASRAFAAQLISFDEFQDVKRILADKTQTAEDALDDLRSTTIAKL